MALVPVRHSLLDDAMRTRLASMYGGGDRHYHSMTHVEDLLSLAGRHSAALHDLPAMEAAIWFHDAILDTRRSDNEAQSARLAAEWLAGRAGKFRIDGIALMIEATASHAIPPDTAPELGSDTALFLDMDLSVLGADRARFDAYEAAVRREYHWVDEAAWRNGRAQVLRRFLDRPAIYATAAFRDACEAAARRNIAHSLAQLA